MPRFYRATLSPHHPEKTPLRGDLVTDSQGDPWRLVSLWGLVTPRDPSRRWAVVRAARWDDVGSGESVVGKCSIAGV